jgi:hypothetical protein
MPKDIVQKCRDVYTNYFMVPTLRNFRQDMKVRAFDDEGHGFPGHYITVHLNAEPHPDIFAACVSMRNENGQIETCIGASRFLAKLSKQDQKIYLAHEWIHAMMMFRSENENVVEERRLSNQSEDSLYRYWLAFNPFWQDEESFLIELKGAMKQLLVPDDLVYRVLKEDFKIDINELCDKSNESPKKAIDTINDFVMTFSARYSVSPEMVNERLIDMIFEDKSRTQFLSIPRNEFKHLMHT